MASLCGFLAPLLLALTLVSVGGCSGGAKRTGAEIEFESELIAIAKKAKSHMAFKQAMEDKIMEKHGFVVTRKPSAKGKKKVR